MGATFKPNPAGIAKFKRQLEKTLNLTADLLAQKINPQVPFKSGALALSAFTNGRRVPNTKDSESVKFISYSSPYALKQYYGVMYRHTTDKHPEARAFWGKDIMDNQALFLKIYEAAKRQIGG